ncbi:hypothetical protein, partial [Escherichia coli]|uniref:hypothetical protein n=1 Tax=Escherichia coli TaxID=562 RepID=UPI0039895267
MKIGTVAGTNGSTTTIATNDMVQEHVTNFTKELFGYIANGIGDDISSIARTMLGGFAPIFPDTCYHLTHYWPAAADIPV